MNNTKMISSKAIEVRFEIIRVLVSIGIALLATLVLIGLVSRQPMEALSHFLLGPVQSLRNFGNVMELFIPLTFTGLAVSVMFQCNQFNMAAEGAFFIGGLGAGMVATRLVLPMGLHPLAATLFGGLLGSVTCTIPGFFKVKWGANEVVSSLMLNYILLYLGSYLLQYRLLDPRAGYPASDTFPSSAILPKLTSSPKVHAGIILVALFVVVIYLFLYKSKWGYAIRTTGCNEIFAKYSGISVGFTILLSQIVGGAIAGVGGAVEVLGMYTRFSWTVLPGYGFDGIIIATLAKNNPAYVPLAAFFLAYLRIGADIMARRTDVATEVIAVVQASIILLVAAKMFLGKLKHRQIVANSQKHLLQKEDA